MGKNKINFITGETYTLAELFSGERRVIIPDLQRDYCWGDDTNIKSTGETGKLVTDFINNLIEQYDVQNYQTLNIGLFYGYEMPANHIQLCDGQQRLTTLYLLLGMINKKTGKFRQNLISDYEFKHDDKEPYLNYSIRESSLYFLSDLVCKFFISNDDTVESIRSTDWYFADYDLDPTICSMINALRKIEIILTDKNFSWLISFGDWILNKLTFLYFDMETRRNGEETFVVINTTGEPLSATQALKPLVIFADINKEVDNIAAKWEEIETWFWKKRQKSNNNDTADAGFNEFMRWITMLQVNKDKDEETAKFILAEGLFSFPWKLISFTDLYKYWEIVRFLFEEWEYAEQLNSNYLSPSANSAFKSRKVIGQIDCFLILPLIAYCKKWNISDSNDRNLLRFYKFIQNLSRIGNVGKSVNDLVFDAVQIANKCRDIIELIDDGNDSGISDILLSKEEKIKLAILKESANRIEIEQSFWKAQDYDCVHSHEIWMGEIMPLIKWATDKNGKFHFDSFKMYLSQFDEVFSGECDEGIDNVRRALLTIKLTEYPKIFKGNSNYSFGWEWSDWHCLINDNEEKFKSFFDDLKKGITLDNMIQSFNIVGEWADFIQHKCLLGYCEKKNVQKDDKYGVLLIKRSNKRNYISVPDMLLYEYLFKENWQKEWKLWIFEQNRVVLENKNSDFVFDIWFCDQKWDIQFFSRKKHDTEYLKKYVDEEWVLNDKENRYEKRIDYEYDNATSGYPNVKELLLNMINILCEKSKSPYSITNE